MSFLKYLQRHPFPVVAYFDRVAAVSFAFPVDVLRPLVPAALELDAYEGFGFVTVAMVWTKNLHPEGFPAFLGQDFSSRAIASSRDSATRDGDCAA